MGDRRYPWLTAHPGAIVTDEAAEQPTSETRSSHDLPLMTLADCTAISEPGAFTAPEARAPQATAAPGPLHCSLLALSCTRGSLAALGGDAMARRVVLFVVGGVLLVIGVLAAIAGGALMAFFGSNDTLSSGVQQVSTPTRALVSAADSIQGASGAQTVFGSVRLRVTATPTGAGHLLFLGIGPASAVDRYLNGVSHDVATDVSVTPFHLTLARQGGTAAPPPPESQSFWVAKASGNHPTLTWTVTSGSYRVVVMNTDAAAPVAFAGGLNLTIPHSFAIGIGLLIGGIVLVLIAIVLIVLGARARPQSLPVPDPATGP